MAIIIKSLTQISTSHPEFKEDQVLTHTELNRLVSYMDDQERLTRVDLSGVGIACGLRVSLANGRVIVTKGVGVTTDGDLVRIPGDTVFTNARPYSKGAPEYGPFRDLGSTFEAWELVREGTTGPSGFPLSELGVRTGRALADMAVVLLVESYVKDRDLCVGADCDERGAEVRHDVKLLLVENSAAQELAEVIRGRMSTPDRAAAGLPVIVAPRVLLAPEQGGWTVAKISARYREVCHAMHDALGTAVPELRERCGALFADLLSAERTSGWIGRLIEQKAKVEKATLPELQDHHDFLGDLIETYEALREQLTGITDVCCPDVEAFPKHLVLGRVSVPAGGEDHRTAFYSSPATGRAATRLDHARFLAAKLDVLVRSFELPAVGSVSDIRVTPSMGEDRSLEERAIPYYYKASAGLDRLWSWELARTGRLARGYRVRPENKDPLDARIGGCSFFRVEGHRGLPVSAVVAHLTDLIKKKNLPFTVCAVGLGTDPTKVPAGLVGGGFSDIHRVHAAARWAFEEQLNDVEGYHGSQMPLDMQEQVRRARKTLRSTYAAYSAGRVALGVDVAEAQFRGRIISSNEHSKSSMAMTHLDAFVHSALWELLLALDRVIGASQEARLLFDAFLERDPGLEHTGGVARGGTLVLVYDASDSGKHVVADFMLSYVWREGEAEAEEALWDKVGVKVGDEEKESRPPRGGVGKDGFTPGAGWKEVATVEHVTREAAKLQNELEKQKIAFDTFRQTLASGVKVGGASAKVVEDAFLDSQLEELELKDRQATLLRERVMLAGTTDERAELETQLVGVETDLAKAAGRVLHHIRGSEVKAGTDASKALLIAAQKVSTLSVSSARTRAHEELERVWEDKTTSDQVKNILGVVNDRFRSSKPSG